MRDAAGCGCRVRHTGMVPLAAVCGVGAALGVPTPLWGGGQCPRGTPVVTDHEPTRDTASTPGWDPLRPGGTPGEAGPSGFRGLGVPSLAGHRAVTRALWGDPPAGLRVPVGAAF